MQSFIALAGVVGLAAASYAPQYDDDVRTTQEAAFPNQYNDYSRTTQEAAFPTQYDSADIRTVDAQLPAYSNPVDDDRFTIQPHYTQTPRFNSPLLWSTTRFIRTSAYETYCPEATTLTFNTESYTVTAATTLTVTDCYNGCQVVKPLPTTTVIQTAPIIRTTQYETYCPEPTTLTFSAQTFTITQATTLTFPQNITTNTVYKTIVPLQPSYVTVNSTVRTTFKIPQPTVEPYVPAPTQARPVPTTPIVEPFVPGTATPPAPVAPIETNPIVEPFVPSTEVAATIVPTTAIYDAVVPLYPIATSETLAYLLPNATGTGRVDPTSPVQYTGAAAGRIGAGALLGVVGILALL